MDYFEAVRKEVAKKRQEITKNVPRGAKRTAAMNEFEAQKTQFESQTLERLMKEGTDQRMADLPAVVNDAA